MPNGSKRELLANMLDGALAHQRKAIFVFGRTFLTLSREVGDPEIVVLAHRINSLYDATFDDLAEMLVKLRVGGLPNDASGLPDERDPW